MATAIKPIIGGSGNDQLNGGNGHEVFSGRGGDDLIQAGNGDDKLWGGSGDDTLKGQPGNDSLYGGGGPTYIDLPQLSMANNYQGRVIFEGETAGYRNTLGSYKVDNAGNIYGIAIHFANASLSGSGGDLSAGVSASPLNISAGDLLGFFIIANGYSVNGGYANIDLNSGQLQFRDGNGAPAGIHSNNPSLWHVADDGVETELKTNKYHTAAGINDTDYSLNPDGIAHTVGLLDSDAGVLTLGFEDLYNGGDLDFDDSVFSLDLGVSNARVLDPNIDPNNSNGDNNQPGNDAIYLLSDNDILFGGTGNDDLHGRRGDDQLYGDNGNDVLYGGSGNDHLEGGRGVDHLHGGSGSDMLLGNNGADFLFGNNGDDQLFGNSGNDQLSGGSNNDWLDGGTGNDELLGGSGDDQLFGNSGHDQLNGGSGNDFIEGGTGNDELLGGSGNDELVAGSGHDVGSGGSGDDQLFGHSGNDQLSGGSGNDLLDGGSGNDELEGGSGNDVFLAGFGNDVCSGGSGDDFFYAGRGRDNINGGSGSDTVSYQDCSSSVRIDLHAKRSTGGDSDSLNSIENAIGSAQNDWFRGDIRDNQLSGGSGDDIIRGAKGTDLLSGGSGSDSFVWRYKDIASSIDTISDFNSSEDLIALDITDLFAQDPLSDWLSLIDNGQDSTLYVDRDGDGGQYQATAFVTLAGVTGLSLEDLTVVDSDGLA